VPAKIFQKHHKNHNVTSDFDVALKFEAAAIENKQRVDKLRFENAGLRKALDETCKKLEL
jgi:uncharacterized membrane protein